MAEPAPLPSLFGRFTAIFRDHDELGKTLAELRKMCAALEAAPQALSSPRSPPLLLARLEADLKQHFEAEESASYFGTVVDEAPELGPQIAALKWEHLAMLKAIHHLLDISRAEACRAELCARTLDLIAELERHERSESVLLRQLFRSSAPRRG